MIPYQFLLWEGRCLPLKSPLDDYQVCSWLMCQDGSEISCLGHWESCTPMRGTMSWIEGEGQKPFSWEKRTMLPLLIFWKKRRICGMCGFRVFNDSESRLTAMHVVCSNTGRSWLCWQDYLSFHKRESGYASKWLWQGKDLTLEIHFTEMGSQKYLFSYACPPCFWRAWPHLYRRFPERKWIPLSHGWRNQK